MEFGSQVEIRESDGRMTSTTDGGDGFESEADDDF